MCVIEDPLKQSWFQRATPWMGRWKLYQTPCFCDKQTSLWLLCKLQFCFLVMNKKWNNKWKGGCFASVKKWPQLASSCSILGVLLSYLHSAEPPWLNNPEPAKSVIAWFSFNINCININQSTKTTVLLAAFQLAHWCNWNHGCDITGILYSWFQKSWFWLATSQVVLDVETWPIVLQVWFSLFFSIKCNGIFSTCASLIVFTL